MEISNVMVVFIVRTNGAGLGRNVGAYNVAYLHSDTFK